MSITRGQRGYGYSEMLRVLAQEELENDQAYHNDCHEYSLKNGSSDMDAELYSQWVQHFEYDLARGTRDYHYKDSLI